MRARTGVAESWNGFAAAIVPSRPTGMNLDDHSPAHYAPLTRGQAAVPPVPRNNTSRRGERLPENQKKLSSSPDAWSIGLGGVPESPVGHRADRSGEGRGGTNGIGQSTGGLTPDRRSSSHGVRSRDDVSGASIDRLRSVGWFHGAGLRPSFRSTGARCNRRRPEVSIHPGLAEDLHNGPSRCQDRPVAR